MTTVRIQTSQNVDIEYEVAGIGERILAFVVDFIIILSYISFIALILSPLYASIVNKFNVAFFIFVYMPVLLYDLIFEIMLNGQSIGKKLLKIKVIKLDGSQASISSYLLRWLFRLIDVSLTWGSVALVTLAVNSKGQRLGDIAAGTTIIKLKSKTKLSDTVFTKVEEDYQVIFPQAAELSDNVIETIKEVLKVSLDEDRHDIKKSKLIQKTKKKVAQKLNIESDMTSKQFLETILKDYNYLKITK